MDKEKDNSTFDYDDVQFNDKLNKNIEKALGDTETFSQDEMKSSSKEQSETVATLDDHSGYKEEEKIEDELTGINESLAMQISTEIELSSEQLKKKKKLKKIYTGIGISLLSIVLIGVFLVFTPPGNKLLLSIGVNASGALWDRLTHKFDDGTDVVEDEDFIDEDDKKSNAPELNPATISWPSNTGEGRHEDGVYNILLLGEESIGMGGRGHTDVIVIATMNTKTKTVKLTSLMRDTYVQIPGYNDNKLNSAYAKGGLDLLYETISLNFNIKLDGCVKVGFDNFEKIIDRIGGVDITLKKVEADYLNSTNYISNKQYRNVKEGLNHFVGNQALGYARIRKISTITGKNNDYGRTDRHRIILNEIFEKCKSKSKTELATMMVDFLPMITTDIGKQNFQALLNSFMDMGLNTKKIEQLRIPVDGAFTDNIKVRGMSVVIPDLQKNINALHSFIFDDPTPTPTPAGGENSSTASNKTSTSSN